MVALDKFLETQNAVDVQHALHLYLVESLA